MRQKYLARNLTSFLTTEEHGKILINHILMVFSSTTKL